MTAILKRPTTVWASQIVIRKPLEYISKDKFEFNANQKIDTNPARIGVSSSSYDWLWSYLWKVYQLIVGSWYWLI